MQFHNTKFTRTIFAGAVALFTTVASAHDLTVYPQTRADTVELKMYLGDPGDYQPINQVQFIDLKIFKPGSARPGEIGPIYVEGAGPPIATSSAVLGRDAEGTYLISSHYDNGFATFDATHRGIRTTKEWVRGSTDSAHFIKFAKSLFNVGRSDQSYARILNDRLEFVPLDDPFKVAQGATLRVKVLFDGKSLSNHKVEVGDDTIVSRGKDYKTDDKGVVLVPIDHTGFYRLAVDMRAKSKYPILYDWDDYTASLVFRL